LTDKIIDVLKTKYGIISTKCEVIERLLFRKSFIVNDVSGNKYIVKAYSTKLNLEKLKCIWNCYKILEDYQVVTNSIIEPTNGNEDLFFTIDGNNYVVFSYIEGKVPSLYDVEEIAIALREYHKVSNQLLQFKMISSTKKDLEESRNELKKFDYNGNELGAKIILLRERIINLIDCFKVNNNVLIHGDVIIENTIKTLNGVRLIDFDSIRYGDPIEDVANLVFSILYFGTNPYKILTDREEYIKKFLNTYFQSSIQDYEIIKIEYFMKVHCIVELARHLENFRFLIRAPGMPPYIELLLEIIQRDDLIRKCF
jgi:tRNA A-37 threonylcarbamoyl transferase component Bud32